MTSTTIRDTGLALRGEVADIVAHAINWQGEAGKYATRDNVGAFQLQGTVDSLRAAVRENVFTDKGDALAQEALALLEPAAQSSTEKRAVRELTSTILGMLHDDETIGMARVISTRLAAGARQRGISVDALTLGEMRAAIAEARR